MPRTDLEVESREEAKLLKKGLERKDVRAFVKVMGALSGLSAEEAMRVMKVVSQKFEIE